MRLLICTDSYPPQLNGVSVVTALTVEGLQARGWDCHVVAPWYPVPVQGALVPPAAVPVTGVPSFALPGYPDVRVPLPLWGRLQAVARRFAPTLVHCTTEFVLGRLGQGVARQLGVPMVSSYHTDFARYTDSYGIPWMRRPVSAWITRFHARSQLVLTPSSASREALRDLPAERVAVWGRGIDTQAFHPRHRTASLRERLAQGASFLCLYAGRLAPEKNVAVLVRAFERWAGQVPAGSARLLIAGDGPSLPGLRAVAGPQVTFLGAVDRTRDLPALYASCDVFAYASTTETLGLVVLEAMASGLPVVAVPAGGVADHLEHERNGLAYADGAEGQLVAALHRLWREPATRAALSAGARASAERKGWDAELDRLDAAFRALVRGSAVTARSGAVPQG